MSAPKRRGLTPQQRESAWLQSLATARNRSGYPLPAIPQAPRRPRRAQRAVLNAAPRPRRAQQRNKSRAGYGPGAMVPYLGPPRSMQNRQIGSERPNAIRNGNGRTGVGTRFGGMSECARLYAIGIVNPFSFIDATEANQNRSLGFGAPGQLELPCLPNFPTLKTLRFSCFARGTMTTFTDGTGYVAFAPFRAGNNYPVTNNSGPPVFVSNATVSTAAFPVMDTNAVPSGAFGLFSYNSAYTIAQLVAAINYRVVGAGIRVRYAGTEMNRGGIMHCIEEPNHVSLSNMPVATISQYESYFRAPVTRDWTDLVYTPTQQAELDMNPDPLIGNFFTGHYMGMLIASAAPSTLFEWEAVGLFEINGTVIRGMTYSETDLRGFEMVQNAIRPETQLVRNQVGPSGIFKLIMDGANYLTRQAPAARAIGRLGAAFL